MKRAYKKGDIVRLLSVPMFPNEPDTKADGVGQLWVIDQVRNTAADGSVWYDVAGWCVQADNLEPADEAP